MRKIKLLFCARCGDIRGLISEKRVYCDCEANWAEWSDPFRGKANYGGELNTCFGIGLHNGLLRSPLQDYGLPTRADYRMWAFADGYIFKEMESMMIVFRPGQTSDTRFIAE